MIEYCFKDGKLQQKKHYDASAIDIELKKINVDVLKVRKQGTLFLLSKKLLTPQQIIGCEEILKDYDFTRTKVDLN